MSLSTVDNVSKLKIVLREEDCPFFTDEELNFYLSENGQDFKKTAYQCLILKAENTNLVLSGLETADTSKYFRRVAQRYRENNSRVLGE